MPTPIDVEEDTEAASATPNTTVVVITTDVPAKVERSKGIEENVARRGRLGYWVARSHQWETVCAATPCTVRVPVGTSTFHFIGDGGRESTTTVVLRNKTEVVNHTLGQEHGSIGTYVGVGLVVVGLAALVFPFGFDLDQPKAAPGILVAAGIGSIFTGITVIGLDPGIKQPGATTQWTPERKAPPPVIEGSLPAVRGTSLGFKF